jgi:adenylyltransferase/sulfurtransferase
MEGHFSSNLRQHSSSNYQAQPFTVPSKSIHELGLSTYKGQVHSKFYCCHYLRSFLPFILTQRQTGARDSSYMERIDQLRREIALRESDLADLRSQLAVAESEQRARQDDGSSGWKWPLAQHEYDRYSRQMIVPKLGLESQ